MLVELAKQYLTLEVVCLSMIHSINTNHCHSLLPESVLMGNFVSEPVFIGVLLPFPYVIEFVLRYFKHIQKEIEFTWF
jgi:hypothetical protein